MEAQQESLLYSVALRGAPEVFSLQRAQLQARLQLMLDHAYGSHQAAASALHAYLDSLDLMEGELGWGEALDAATRQLAVQLPPGARFECSLVMHEQLPRVS